MSRFSLSLGQEIYNFRTTHVKFPKLMNFRAGGVPVLSDCAPVSLGEATKPTKSWRRRGCCGLRCIKSNMSSTESIYSSNSEQGQKELSGLQWLEEQIPEVVNNFQWLLRVQRSSGNLTILRSV